ncbi:MAG: EAL domain-containing response regulator [Sphingomonadales bacterium]|nr:EAL domain-containing response regulator [Sphingomonadales bacterium]
MEKLKAIIADDDIDICDLLGDILEGMGYDYEHVQNGTEFPELFMSYQPHLVFLDLKIPGKDGIELIEFLGTQNTKTKVIMMSGMDSRTLSSAQKLAQMNNVEIVTILQKPVMLDELEEVIGSIAPPPIKSRPVNADDIRQAIIANELEVYYQPQMCVVNDMPPFLKGVEALLRWDSAIHGSVSPVTFIPIAEEDGCIYELTNFVFEQVLKEKSIWKELGFKLQTSINISQSLLSNNRLADLYEKIVTENGVDPNEITLEVTETSIMTDPVQSLSALTRMRLKGFQLSLDDFGTGYSSMAHLYRMPINEIKIDKMFVQNAMQDKEALEIVHFLIKLGESLGLEICIEGVEDPEIIEQLKSDRTILIQGFYFSRPLPANQFIEFARKHSLNASTEEQDGAPNVKSSNLICM